jgi:hypothetical protein
VIPQEFTAGGFALGEKSTVPVPDIVQTSSLNRGKLSKAHLFHVDSNPASPEGHMNRDCKQGLRLRLHFEHTLKEWGWFDAYEQALELMPVGPPQVHEFQQEAQHAHAELIRARRAYIEHMASCLACSRRLISSDAVVSIREKLNTSRLQ